ncbi:MAG: hypothetical protein H6737_14885 [Alphaproteobacteria bacterium]|nr:hypothetical protein [Alphaproteobacteria bacterium]
MLSKQTSPDAGAEVTAAKQTETVAKTEPAKEPSTLQSQEFLRDQLAATEPEKTTSYLLGSTKEGSGDLSATRGDSFLVGDKTVSSNLGANTKSVSSLDLGSSRDDKFLVDGKVVSSDLGANTKSVSSLDLGSSRDDKFAVDGKIVSSDLGANTKSVSSLDLGSSRDDKFAVAGKVVSSDLGANTKSVSSLDLGSSRDETTQKSVAEPTKAVEAAPVEQVVREVVDQKAATGASSSTKSAADVVEQVKGTTDLDLAKPVDLAIGELAAVEQPKADLADIPGLKPPEGQNVSVSLPLAPAVAAAKIEQGETLSKPLEQAAIKAVEEKATLIHPEDIPAGLLEVLPKDTVLRFAFSPEDMGALDLQAEHDSIAAVADVFTLNNPTVDTMKHVLATGQFEDVIWSGHGSTDGLWITGNDGKAVKLSADQVADLFKDTSVKEMLLNVCNGGAQVDNAIAKTGITTYSHDREIIDAEAVADATRFAETGSVFQIDNLNKWERRLDPTAATILTQKGALRQEQWDAAVAQRDAQRAEWGQLFGDWHQGSVDRKNDTGGMFSSLFKGIGNLFGGSKASPQGQQKSASGAGAFAGIKSLFGGAKSSSPAPEKITSSGNSTTSDKSGGAQQITSSGFGTSNVRSTTTPTSSSSNRALLDVLSGKGSPAKLVENLSTALTRGRSSGVKGGAVTSRSSSRGGRRR